MEVLSVEAPQMAINRLGQAYGLLQHSVEHRREVPSGRIDDLQYLGGRGLLFQGLVALGGALGQPLLHIGEFALEVGDNLLRIG